MREAIEKQLKRIDSEIEKVDKARETLKKYIEGDFTRALYHETRGYVIGLKEARAALNELYLMAEQGDLFDE